MNFFNIYLSYLLIKNKKVNKILKADIYKIEMIFSKHACPKLNNTEDFI